MGTCTTGTSLSQRRESLDQGLPLDFPWSLNIESTNLCNLECFYCPRQESSKGTGLMDFGLFTRLVDECAENGPVKLLNLHKDGEPLAHPRILDMVRYVADRGAAERHGFTTNGILFTDARARQLVDAGLNKISFSIDAVTEATYAQTKGRSKYRVVEANVRQFLSWRPPHVKAAVKFIRMQENRAEEEAFVETWSGCGAEIIVNEYHDWSGSVRDSSLLDVLPVSEYACENPFYSLAVNWDGSVSICCVDWDSRALVGDANQQRLVDIWRGEPLRRVRELHLCGKAGTVAACGGCTYKSRENRELLGSWLMQNRERVMAY
jgi:MoaA/NifB/PqqE/SkfB family radical SAM enzyme